MNHHPLSDCLALAVNLKILDLQRKGGPTSQQFEQAKAFGDTLAHKGDNILYRSPKRGETADLFNQLTAAIAICSFLPGGVKVLDRHFTGEVHGNDSN